MTLLTRKKKKEQQQAVLKEKRMHYFDHEVFSPFHIPAVLLAYFVLSQSKASSIELEAPNIPKINQTVQKNTRLLPSLPTQAL